MTIFHVLKYPVADILKAWNTSALTWDDYFPSEIADKIRRARSISGKVYSVEMITRILMEYEGPLE